MAYSSSYSALIAMDRIFGIRDKGCRGEELCFLSVDVGVVKPAFQMAYNEDIIRRNPFDFKLVDVVPNDSQKRIAMTEEQ